LDWLYPAGGEWMRSRVTQAVAEAEVLGLVAARAPGSAGVALLETGVEAAATEMQRRFPDEVDKVYLQHDLSVISPGPLAARVDARLRRMAEPENRGLASTYRITGATITRALIEGETADGIRAFLSEISLTGLPQPLDYLLRDTAERFGALRVGRLDASTATAGQDSGARTYVRSDDATLIAQIAVDPALSAVALTRTGDHRVVSRFDASVVYWSLIDARYPAAAEDADGQVMRLRRTPAPVESSERADPARALIERLRGDGPTTGETTGVAWIARQLELAAKGKTVVAVTVRMPDGSEQELRLEPASVAGGRLRARDARADLERTLPLSSITAVTPLT
ncbi:MAG: helicase-associated domain-containing protein, partial [Microbacteriaceae bacterium]